MVPERSEAPASRVDLPLRGLHPAESDVSARQGRVYAILQLFSVAKHEVGVDAIFHRFAAVRCAGVLPAESLAQHARYPAAIPAIQRPARVHDSAHPGGDSRRELWNLWPGFRTL